MSLTIRSKLSVEFLYLFHRQGSEISPTWLGASQDFKNWDEDVLVIGFGDKPLLRRLSWPCCNGQLPPEINGLKYTSSGHGSGKGKHNPSRSKYQKVSIHQSDNSKLMTALDCQGTCRAVLAVLGTVVQGSCTKAFSMRVETSTKSSSSKAAVGGGLGKSGTMTFHLRCSSLIGLLCLSAYRAVMYWNDIDLKGTV